MRRRKGFTITELLVAMALIIFIMYILAEAFAAGTTAFRNLKAVGDMSEKLRTTGTILRKYLAADHFDGRRRLSDPDFWKDGPPREGFLRIYNGSAGTYEGGDLDGNSSYRAADHGLHFAVKLRGNNRGDYFRATVPGTSPLLLLPAPDTRFQEAGSNTVCSSWAEVAFFLRASGDVTEDVENPSQAGQPLHVLFLRQRLCLPDDDVVTRANPAKVAYADYNPAGHYVELSCQKNVLDQAKLYFNSPADLTMPVRRMGLPRNDASPYFDFTRKPPLQDSTILAGKFAPYQYATLQEEPGALYEGNDILLTNVLSFEVRVLLHESQWPAGRVYDFVTLHDPAITQFTAGTGNPAFGAAGVFDTWSGAKDDVYDYSRPVDDPDPNRRIPLYSNAAGQKIRLKAIQVTIRIWDLNTKQTRQTSVVVEL